MKIRNKFANKEYLEEIIKESLSKAEVLRKLDIVAAGGNYKTLMKYVDLYNIDISHFTGKIWNQGDRFKSFCIKYPIDYYLVENKYCSTSSLKKRLIEEGYKIHKCEKCNLTEWNNLSIPIELDHINGKNNDNRLENLRFLCPNCHAQTDTYRGKNQLNKNVVKSIKKFNKKIDNNPEKTIEKKFNNCQICNSETKRSKFCSYDCMHKFNSRNIPSKEKLVDRIKIIGKNFSALGRDFGVSDNAVRKWFLKYDLI